jgi:hypothetical protein
VTGAAAHVADGAGAAELGRPAIQQRAVEGLVIELGCDAPGVLGGHPVVAVPDLAGAIRVGFVAHPPSPR